MRTYLDNNSRYLYNYALSRFDPQQNSVASRIIPRAQVFFIALAASINDLLSSTISLFSRVSSPSVTSDTTTTRKTSSVSGQIFSFLWRAPSQKAIVEARGALLYQARTPSETAALRKEQKQIALALQKTPLFSPEYEHSFSISADQFLKYSSGLKERKHQSKVDKEALESVSCNGWELKDFVNQESALTKKSRISEQTSSLQQQLLILDRKKKKGMNVKNEIAAVQQELRSLGNLQSVHPKKLSVVDKVVKSIVLNMHDLPQKESSLDVKELSKYLNTHFHVTSFDLELISKIEDPTIKEQMTNLFLEQVGPLKNLIDEKTLEIEAIDCYLEAYAETKEKSTSVDAKLLPVAGSGMETATYESINAIEAPSVRKSTSKGKKTRELVEPTSLTTPTLSSDRLFTIKHPEYAAVLKKIIDQDCIAQLGRDISRRSIGFNLHDYHEKPINEEIKSYPELAKCENRLFLKASSYYQKLKESFSNFIPDNPDQAKKAAIAMMYASSQTMDAEMLIAKYMPTLSKDVEKLKTEDLLPKSFNFKGLSSFSFDEHDKAQKITSFDDFDYIEKDGKIIIKSQIQRLVLFMYENYDDPMRARVATIGVPIFIEHEFVYNKATDSIDVSISTHRIDYEKIDLPKTIQNNL